MPEAARRAARTPELERLEDPRACDEEGLAGGRQLDPPARPIEEREAELGLEGLDLPAQRRLRDVRRARGAPEMALLGDGDEVAQVPELHRPDLDTS